MDKDNCCNGNHGDHNCECEEHNHEHEELEMMQITLDNDMVLDCHVLGLFEVEDTEYIALVPEEDDSVLLYEYIESDGEVELKNIEDDEEFNIVAEAYYELFNDEEE